MKKVVAFLLICFVFTLSACATPTGAATPSEPTPTEGVITTSYQNALPVASQLALGTVNLKGTSNDLSSDQIKSLLTLWKGMVTITSATNPSQIEFDALVSQIQDAMTPTQLEAIASMKLTQADTQKVMQEMGPVNSVVGSARTSGSSSSSSSSRNQGGGFGGDFGGPPGGGGFGGFPGAGGGQSQNQNSVPASTQATIQARMAQRTTFGNTMMYTIVVNYLEQLINPAAQGAGGPGAGGPGAGGPGAGGPGAGGPGAPTSPTATPTK